MTPVSLATARQLIEGGPASYSGFVSINKRRLLDTLVDLNTPLVAFDRYSDRTRVDLIDSAANELSLTLSGPDAGYSRFHDGSNRPDYFIRRSAGCQYVVKCPAGVIAVSPVIQKLPSGLKKSTAYCALVGGQRYLLNCYALDSHGTRSMIGKLVRSKEKLNILLQDLFKLNNLTATDTGKFSPAWYSDAERIRGHGIVEVSS